MKRVRARYAPSPTGLLHIGNARTALFNYLFARHYGGDFIIRIEDTDTARNVEGGIESQLSNLSWLGITWDEGPDIGGPFGPYQQLDRLDLYTKYAEELLERGLAYKDFKEGSEDYAIRFRVPADVSYQFDDVIRGKLEFLSKDVEDWIIMKDNGIPTYNFAVVIDDHFMDITHVFRGEEHITNTPKQLMIYDAFNWERPIFGHMTLIVNENRKKLSKRDTDTIQFIKDYQQLGFLPEAIFNFLSLLGWSPSDDEEILSNEQLISLFDEKRLSSAPSFFDHVKLEYINSRYMKKLTMDELKVLCRPFLLADRIVIHSEEWFERLLTILKDRLNYGQEIVKYYHAFFHDDFKIEKETLEDLKQFDLNQTINLLTEFSKQIEEVGFDNESDIDTIIKGLGKSTGVKGKALYMPLRVGTSGEAHGPSLAASLMLLGKQKVARRLQQTLKILEGETQ